MISLLSLIAVLSTVSASGLLSIPFEKRRSKRDTNSLKRSSHFEPTHLQNDYYEYMVNFCLGTPPQPLKAVLDTGSSDIWVYSQGAELNYDSSASSTSELVLENGFHVWYNDFTGAKGDYYKDVLTLGNVSVTTQFASDSTFMASRPIGIFGIASPADEGTWGNIYPNYPYSLKDAGIIDAVAYSLYLDDADSDYGQLLFGALDKSKYTGELSVLPSLNNYSFSVNASIYNETIEVILDAGASLSFVPDNIMSQIASDFGLTYDGNNNFYKAGSDRTKSLTYTFGNTEITVPPSELYHKLVSGSDDLYFTVLGSGESRDNNLLGDSFLRSAYVVYDMENNCIAIGQANHDAGEPDYEELTSDGVLGLSN